MSKRDLTTLEYVVLGLVSLAPQSGYSIVSFFENDAYSWSASPGSIYPILKRLEANEMLASELEMEYETRPRKVYTLTEMGESALDDWLREIPKMRPFYQEREIALLRFQFMERRLPRTEILTWLDGYLDAVRYASSVQQVYTEPIRKAMADDPKVNSVHGHLLMENYLMEINTLRTWLELARNYTALSPSAKGEEA